MAIKKFSKIDNLAVFSGYSWDANVPEFSKINILYGRNYSGKTTLSRILRAIETQGLPEKYENPSFDLVLDDGSTASSSTLATCGLDIRVFNEDFVRANLRFLIDPDGEIEPFAILGSDNAKTQREIDDLTTEIGSDVKGSETGLYWQLADKKRTASTASTAHSSALSAFESKLSAKATSRQTGIKYNSDRFGNQNYNITNMRTDIAAVTTSTYVALTPDQKVEHERTIAEQPKERIAELVAPKLGLDDFCGRASQLLARKIGASDKIAELLHNAALNAWVKQGKSLLEGQDVCAFCGNLISSERWMEINAHFDEESKKLETEIDALISAITADIQQLERVPNIDKTQYYAKYHSLIDVFITARIQAVSDYCLALKAIIDQLDQRKAKITAEIAFVHPNDNSTNIKMLYGDFNNIIKESNGYAAKLSAAKKKAQEALRLQEVADFCATISYSTERDKIDELSTASKKTQQEAQNALSLLNKKIQEKKDKLRALNDEEEGARRVNTYLNDYFGHNFVSLEAESVTEGEKRIRFRIMRSGKPAYNLSGGECSLIAFCYFMAKLDDVDTQTKKPIVWIDDPISSLDGNHIYFMYSLIVSKITKTGNFEQLFISTHNLDFLKYLRRLNSYQMATNGKQHKVSKQYFLIERNGNQSSIIKMPKYLSNNATEFNYLFSIIYKCSLCTDITDDNYDMLYSFGNNARKFLETFLYFQYPNDTDDLLPKLKRFFGDDDIPPILMDRMLNEDSHGASPEKALKIGIDPETISVAKKIIEKLKENSDQFNALLQSIGITV